MGPVVSGVNTKEQFAQHLFLIRFLLDNAEKLNDRGKWEFARRTREAAIADKESLPQLRAWWAEEEKLFHVGELSPAEKERILICARMQYLESENKAPR